ncbi:MAG: hypothetical protein ACMZ64_01340 [Oleiphilus sp.]
MRVVLIILILQMTACSTLQSLFYAPQDEGPPTTSAGVSDTTEQIPAAPACSPKWYRYVESQLSTQDNQGHGPDIGSQEWQSVVEFKLAIDRTKRASGVIPTKTSPQWCQFIQQRLDRQRSLSTVHCDHRADKPLEQFICQTPELLEQAKSMAKVLQTVIEKVAKVQTEKLHDEQRLWLIERDACRENADLPACLMSSYETRIAALQVKYQLVNTHGPVFYVCDGGPSDEVTIRFFPTTPPSLIAERAGQSAFLLQTQLDGGFQYQGDDIQFLEQQSEAIIRWGSDAPQMSCEKMH